MNQGEPPIHYLEEIDAQLKKLEEERSELEREFGFGDQFSEKESINKFVSQKLQIRKIPDYPKEEMRYDYRKLEDDRIENKLRTLKRKKIKPEISADWVVANKIKPNLMQFYDFDKFHSQVLRNDEFHLTSENSICNKNFDEFMANFALL